MEKKVLVGGVDLAARRPSAYAIGYADGKVVLLGFAWNHQLPLILRNCRVVAIDAPLSHAEGYRQVDLEMKKRGYQVLPPGWRGMRMLVDEAIKLSASLQAAGVEVIETHPRSAEKSYKKDPLEDLVAARVKDKDLRDALICLAVAASYVKGSTLRISASDGTIYLLK